MSQTSSTSPATTSDPVSNVLKWILLAVAVVTFALLGWATFLTYERAPPQPERFVDTGGALLMSADDILAGKAGFQKADLMDFGSLYGMGSDYGQDYTAWALIRLAGLVEARVAQAQFGKTFEQLPPDQQAAVRNTMREQLQHIDLTQETVRVPDALATAIVTLRGDIAKELAATDLDTGWTPAHSLNPAAAVHTAEFLIYSALTTVARRPNVSWSWTENWPYEPEVGNTPTTNTFIWTWASFCFTFLAFGVVLFIYEFWLNKPDDAPMDPVLARFGPLTDSQRRVGKYFLVVAIVLLLQIAAGTIMAHAYYDRRSFYGIALQNVLPFNFLRDVHIQSPIVWIGVSWIGAGLFLAPAIAGGREARGQGFLVDLLFWVTLVIVAGALIGNWLGIMGYIDGSWFWFGNQGLSYIQLGRFWQIGFFIGLVLWSLLVFRALWPTPAMLWQATRQFWTGPHQVGKPDLGRHDQYRRPLCVRHDPPDRHRKVLHAHRFLALVGRASMGRAVVRILRCQHERVSADGGWFGVAQARRTRGVFRAYPDFPRRRDRHRPPSLLGRWPKHVGSDGQHVFLHRGAATGAADYRGDRSIPAYPMPRRRSITGSHIPTS